MNDVASPKGALYFLTSLLYTQISNVEKRYNENLEPESIRYGLYDQERSGTNNVLEIITENRRVDTIYHSPTKGN